MRNIFLFLFLTIGFVNAQTNSYDVLLVGADVGDMTITRTVSGTKKYYSLTTSTSVMFGARKDKYTCTMEFEGNVLIKSTMENRKNGKLIWWTYVNRVGEAGYKVHTDKGLSTIAGGVGYCCYDIFFKEPKGDESVFSERFGKFGQVSKKEDHVYECEIKGEETYTYYFEGGAMTKMETPSFLGKVKMIKK